MYLQWLKLEESKNSLLHENIFQNQYFSQIFAKMRQNVIVAVVGPSVAGWVVAGRQLWRAWPGSHGCRAIPACQSGGESRGSMAACSLQQREKVETKYLQRFALLVLLSVRFDLVNYWRKNCPKPLSKKFLWVGWGPVFLPACVV